VSSHRVNNTTILFLNKKYKWPNLVLLGVLLKMIEKEYFIPHPKYILIGNKIIRTIK